MSCGLRLLRSDRDLTVSRLTWLVELGLRPSWSLRSHGGERARRVNPQMVMYEEEFNQIQTVVDRLVREANAKVVFIVDKNGQLIAASGEVENIDTTSLASLTAGNIAATGGIAKLLRENEFATQFHEGEKEIGRAHV